MKYSAQAYPKFKRTEEKNKPRTILLWEWSMAKQNEKKKIETIIVEQKKEKKIAEKSHT